MFAGSQVPETPFSLGQPVRHALFGEGVILNFEGSGAQARVQVNFARADNPPPPGSERHHLGTWVYSFDDPYPSRLFDEAGALVAECPTFDFRQTDTGNTSSYEVEPLTFPALGDRTVAFRLQIQQTLETITMDFVVVKVGHNTVSVANGAYNGTPDTGVTERAARSVLSDLEQ